MEDVNEGWWFIMWNNLLCKFFRYNKDVKRLNVKIVVL